MGKYSGGSHGTFHCKDHLQSKLVMNVDIPEVHPQLKVIQKSLLVDSSPKLTNNDLIREQSEDSDINLIVQLLKSDKQKRNVAREPIHLECRFF